MSVQSADTARERGRAVTALMAAYPGIASPPWSSAQKRRSFNLNNNHNSNLCNSQTDRNPCDDGHGYDDADEATTVDGDALVGAADQLLSWGSLKKEKQGIDLCASTWKSVESMARMLAGGHSVVSTISRCYSMPDLGRTSGRCGAYRRESRAGTEMMHTSLRSERLAAEALAVFRRCSFFFVLCQEL